MGKVRPRVVAVAVAVAVARRRRRHQARTDAGKPQGSNVAKANSALPARERALPAAGCRLRLRERERD